MDLIRRSLAAALGAAVVAHAPSFAQQKFITVASTTSTEQSGLFKHMLPLFEGKTGIQVRVVALGTDRVLFRPLRTRGASLVLFAMASLAGAFFLRSVIYLIWGSDFIFYYPGRANPALNLPLGVNVQADQIFVFALTLLLVALTWLLLERTRMGKAMRATANNPDLAQVRGINTERVIAWTWILGASLAAAGGVMYALASQLRPEMGFLLLLPMFAAAILGGIGNPVGAVIGAIVIGIAQQVSASFLNPAYGPAVAFVLLVIVLVLRPNGLFGREGE